MPDDSDLQLIVRQFFADAQTLNKETSRLIESIRWVDSFDEATTIGTCEVWTWDDGTVHSKRINLLKSAWNTSSDQTKRTLIYHELGHCALDLDHVERPTVAIMNPVILYDDVAAPIWFNLVRDEFNAPSSLNLADTHSDCIVRKTFSGE
jgi:hypothetical protein